MESFPAARNVPCGLMTFHHLSVCLEDLPLNSVIILCDHDTLQKFLSTFRFSQAIFIILRQLSLQPEDLLLISVNFCALSVRPVDLPSTSVIFPCGRKISHVILSTFHAVRRPFVNFRQLFMWSEDLQDTSVKFSCGQEIFRQLPSTFCTIVILSINFLSSR